MTNPWFEKTLNGDDDFFDDVIKYLDIQLDDVQENSGGEVWDCNFQNLEPPPAGVLADFSSSFYRDVFGDSIVESLTFPVSSTFAYSDL
ncbi:Detected protein of unknown function [Hibiscus syriacus]|uniref:Uncharacterized protein n=1 Tax=Hibiscus syriacus TaxID=106335 RepID=A0A6A3B4U6_HIBSY|nr:Detected protein of unknown function [Hibiscus syriacus]